MCIRDRLKAAVLIYQRSAKLWVKYLKHTAAQFQCLRLVPCVDMSHYCLLYTSYLCFPLLVLSGNVRSVAEYLYQIQPRCALAVNWGRK